MTRVRLLQETPTLYNSKLSIYAGTHILTNLGCVSQPLLCVKFVVDWQIANDKRVSQYVPCVKISMTLSLNAAKI